ncbi:TPA: hypothetical protein ACSP88_001591 [Aeromonas hydrophila]|uniref:hypothetical protein n=1 Tax=Aeromonas hydrophila TaxID=644 RepID=UPI0038D203A0
MSINKALLTHAKNELNTAIRACERMRTAQSMSELESEWRIYLSSIEKCWVKTERACQEFQNKFQPWQGKYKSIRKTDQLLKYLYHARHSDQHSIQEIIEPKPSTLISSIGEPGQNVSIRYLTTNLLGGIDNYQGSHPIITISLPARIEALPVLSSKKWYEPPKKHLGKLIPLPTPIVIAELGISFYQEYINQVESKFFE